MELDEGKLTQEEKKLRDQFAEKAMSSLLNVKSLRECDDAYEQIARDCFGYADAMILARRGAMKELGIE